MQAVSTYTAERMSEARQAIYRLASFPISRKDIRISSDLKTTLVAQGTFKKAIACLTCDKCCSRSRYEKATSLEQAREAFISKIQILAQELPKDMNLRHALADAQDNFNAVIDRCSRYRKIILPLKVDYTNVLQEISQQNSQPTSPLQPPFPRRTNQQIDYSVLLQRLRTIS